MARRSILAAAFAAVALACSASALAATAPTDPPTLTTAPYVVPATFTWTPAANGPDPLDPNTAQQVFRADGACPQGPVIGAQSVGPVRDMTAASHTTSGTLASGIYCFFIRTTSLLGGTADGPGLTVPIDTQNPTGTVAVTPMAPGSIVTGTVSVSGTSADSVSGVNTSTFHVGAANACAAGVVVGPTWDTTTSPNGSYQVCNVIIDNAGHQAVISIRVTVANPVTSPGAPAAPAGGNGASAATPPVVLNPINDPAAPLAPTKVGFTLPRAKGGTGTVSVRLHWVKPTASDLARIVVVLNLRRPPRSPADGLVAYRGLGTSAALRLKVGSTGYVALFAYDRSGNFSSPARKVVSLAPLIPLRPTTGSSVSEAPRLTWKTKAGTAYYNVQLFHNGSRVLTGWPSRAAFSIPKGKLQPGTYVWFVWPAVRHAGKVPTFGKLIGRATFVYKAR
jgi:hypothetical protein